VKKPSQKDLNAFMRRKGEECGERWSEIAKRRMPEQQLIPLAAHQYAVHCERLRRLSTEIARLAQALCEVQGFVRCAAVAERSAAHNVMLGVPYVSRARSSLKAAEGPRALLAADVWREGLLALDTHEKRFLAATVYFFQETREAGEALGPDFAKKLARCCSDRLATGPLTSLGWGFFRNWLAENRPELVADLFDAPSSTISENGRSNLVMM